MTATLLSDYDAAVNELVRKGAPREAAIAAVRHASISGAPDPATIDRASEKQIEHAGDKLMQQLGFEVIRFSHPGKTKQTPGIADRRYYRRPRCALVSSEGQTLDHLVPPIVVWWEAKSSDGEQRPGQKLFQELVEACGEAYVCGTYEALIDWLVEHKIAVRVGNELRPWQSP